MLTVQTLSVIDAVNAIVSPAYLVGGAVRDGLMGAEPKDYDFITPMLPDDVEQAVKAAGRHAWTAGKRFGTIGFKVDVDGTFHMVEVTTFRHEEYEAGCRKPRVVYVSSITDDLSRHDFTVNAMAISPKRVFIDPFGGLEDCDNHVLKAVGNPTLRFNEDPLRMLRAARFVSTKGLVVEEATYKSICKHPHRILNTSKERWMAELDKLLLGDNVDGGLCVLWSTGLMRFMLPELAPQYYMDQFTPYHDFLLHVHTAKVVNATPKDITLRWAALLHDVGKPFVQTFKPRRPDVDEQATYIKHEIVGAELVDGIAFRLKWSNQRREDVKSLVLHHLDADSPLKAADSGSQKRA